MLAWKLASARPPPLPAVLFLADRKRENEPDPLLQRKVNMSAMTAPKAKMSVGSGSDLAECQVCTVIFRISDGARMTGSRSALRPALIPPVVSVVTMELEMDGVWLLCVWPL